MAAAAQLAIVTKAATKAAAGNPDIELAIIQACNAPGSLGPNSSQSILGAMSSVLAEQATNPGTEGAITNFDKIYTDLSAAAGAATVVTPHFTPEGEITSFTQSTAASDIVGGDIAAAVPKNPAQWVSQIYESGADAAIATNGFAGVTFATAAALAKQGNSGMASALVTGATQGFQSLKQKTDGDVQAYSGALAPLYNLQTTWGPFMTGAELKTATKGYLTDHPDVVATATNDLATISQDGDAIVMAGSAWGTYGMPGANGMPGAQSSLAGITGVADLSSAAKSLTGNDPLTAFAVSQSDALKQMFLTALRPPSGGHPGGALWQTLWQDVTHFPGLAERTMSTIITTPGVDRALRSTINAWLKALKVNKENAAKAAARLSGQPVASTPTYARSGLALSALGLVLTGMNLYSRRGQLFSAHPEVWAYTTYTALGFAKYGGESYAGLAKIGGLPSVLTYGGGKNPVTGWLAGVVGPKSDKLTDAPAFKILGSLYYGFGAFAAGVEGFDSDSNHEAWLNFAEAAGNAGNALKPLLENAWKGEILGFTAKEFAEEFATGSTIVGLIAAVISAGWQSWDSIHQADATANDNINFLMKGAGLSHDQATWLAEPTYGSTSSLSQTMIDYATYNKVSPGDLMESLKRLTSDQVFSFVHAASLTNNPAILNQITDTAFGPNWIIRPEPEQARHHG
jgi:hypothetical protein